ncbi:MAG: DUF481 domain-containing protein [Elusimicrobia bacterium]|nr:DUF481 domain-containing protein [Elusimicrobiota bacterium]
MGQKKFWGLDFEFGGGSNRGNADTDHANASVDCFKAWFQSTAYLKGSLDYGTFEKRRYTNHGTFTLRYDHALWNSWKVFAYNTNAYNEFILLKRRITVGAGPWYDLILGPTKHGISLALTRGYEKFEDGKNEREARLSFRDISEIPISKTAEFSADFFYVPRLSGFGDYHVYMELGLETLFWKDNLGLKVSWVDEYDSRPKPYVRKNDAMWLTHLTLHFGK